VDAIPTILRSRPILFPFPIIVALSQLGDGDISSEVQNIQGEPKQQEVTDAKEDYVVENIRSITVMMIPQSCKTKEKRLLCFRRFLVSPLQKVSLHFGDHHLELPERKGSIEEVVENDSEDDVKNEHFEEDIDVQSPTFGNISLAVIQNKRRRYDGP
jgi:hypothetical protein